MKKLVKFFAVIALIVTCSFASLAQTPVKIGHIDFNTLLAAMPGIDSVKIKLQAYQKTIMDQMDVMNAEFENKAQDYQAKEASLSDLIKQTKQKELQDLKTRIEAFQQSAQQNLQSKQQELVAPYFEKAKKAVKEVAKENKFTLVLNAAEDIVLYKDEADDLMLLVKKKLGIQ